jgi:hypothetical protein
MSNADDDDDDDDDNVIVGSNVESSDIVGIDGSGGGMPTNNYRVPGFFRFHTSSYASTSMGGGSSRATQASRMKVFTPKKTNHGCAPNAVTAPTPDFPQNFEFTPTLMTPQRPPTFPQKIF